MSSQSFCVRQQALVNSAASDLEPVVSGVHQGSVLRPLLFLMYILLIWVVTWKTNLHSMLMTLICKIRSPEDRIAASESLCRDFSKIQHWCE